MTTLKAGIADDDEMKDRTIRIARSEEKPTPDEPKVWFTSAESLAQILSSGNRELLRVIDEQSPGSLEEVSQITGRTKPSLSRTLKTMASYSLVRMEKGQGRKVMPRVLYDQVALELPLIERRAAKGGAQ